MRQLYLINERKEKFSFDLQSRVLISGLDGLGFDKKITYVAFDSMHKKINETTAVSNISLSLVFLDGYEGYKKFLNYVESSSNFYLFYKSVDTKYILCEIESLSKTELKSNALMSKCTIKKLSQWFKDVSKEINVSFSDIGKKYPYTYPFTYSDSNEGKINITNNGYYKAPLKIIINGKFENPEIFVRTNNKIIQRAKIYYKSENGRLEIDAFPTDQKITIIENEETINAYEFQDFTADNFIFLDRGTFEIQFKPGAGCAPKCMITMAEGYLGN